MIAGDRATDAKCGRVRDGGGGRWPICRRHLEVDKDLSRQAIEGDSDVVPSAVCEACAVADADEWRGLA